MLNNSIPSHLVNSIPGCPINSIPYSVAMTKKAKLEEWQLEDAARLRGLWDAFNERTKISQAKFAADNKIGTQGMMYQYIKPTTPLNLEVAAKFAKGLGCKIGDFSPTLEQTVLSVLPYISIDAETIGLANWLQSLPKNQREHLIGLARGGVTRVISSVPEEEFNPISLIKRQLPPGLQPLAPLTKENDEEKEKTKK